MSRQLYARGERCRFEPRLVESFPSEQKSPTCTEAQRSARPCGTENACSAYERIDAHLLTKMHATLITAAEYQTHDYYMNIGPLFADPVARLLYAEIASIEEQHVTQYGSLQDPDESWLEKILIHEATEVYTYHSCVESETNPRLKAIWERFLDYELGHLNEVSELFKKFERRDPQEVLGTVVPDPLPFTSQRDFVRQVLEVEVPLRTNGTEFVPQDQESELSLQQRAILNADVSPTNTVSAGYQWSPATELNRRTNVLDKRS